MRARVKVEPGNPMVGLEVYQIATGRVGSVSVDERTERSCRMPCLLVSVDSTVCSAEF